MNKKGFTLIELVAVILILGIIALVAIPVVSNVINDSKKHAAEVTAMSYIKSIDDQNALYKLQPDKFTPIQSGDVDDLIVNIKGDGPTSGTVTVTNGKVSEAELCANGYTVTYNGVSTTVGSKCESRNEGLLSYIRKVNETGIYQTTINNVTYDLNVIVLDGDQTITSNTTYGTLDDCASGTSASDMAKRMVVVKVNGDYTINSNVTVGPVYNETYGGPKGFMLYVTGTLTNNGTIDNSHGAYAEGQDVYLYSNSNGSYEYVPAQGGLGGEKKSGTNSNQTVVFAGNSGASSQVARGTGGGASGGVYVNYDHPETGVSGAGARGTSYSGGSGGGMVASVWGSNVSAQDGAPNGGTGGDSRASWNSNYRSIGGTGNPGGKGTIGTHSDSNTVNAGTNGRNGTGGLLIVYADSIVNNNKISANGTESFGVTLANVSTKIYGGPSGGGSVNIFYNTSYTSTGTVESNGGTNENGVAGGAGSVSIGSLRTGSYVANN